MAQAPILSNTGFHARHISAAPSLGELLPTEDQALRFCCRGHLSDPACVSLYSTGQRDGFVSVSSFTQQDILRIHPVVLRPSFPTATGSHSFLLSSVLAHGYLRTLATSNTVAMHTGVPRSFLKSFLDLGSHEHLSPPYSEVSVLFSTAAQTGCVPLRSLSALRCERIPPDMHSSESK